MRLFIQDLFISILILGACFNPIKGRTQNLPPMTFTIYDSAATRGYYFINPYKNGPPYNYDRGHVILDRYGRVIFYRILESTGWMTPSVDFKIQRDGRMSYFNLPRGKFMILDSTFTEVDSIACIHGFDTDQHDFQILPNGHYLLFGIEPRNMNLTAYHWFGFNHNQPGSSNAIVQGVVIQEFDQNKTMVWEWKAHDHFQFGDVDERWLSSGTRVDWTHANAVEWDNDGNILLSMRHFDEITKINRTTGDVIWRMGGKMNQFNFINDTIRYTGQHDIRRVSDTSVSLFDNGQISTLGAARALEYSLDEQNKIARLVWQYIYDSSLYSTATGNHQYPGNGNHVIDYGFTGMPDPWLIVVKQDKSDVARLSMPLGYSSYRAFNYDTLPWQLNRPQVTCGKIGESYYLVAEPGHSEYRWSTGDTTSSILISDTGTYSVFVPYGKGYLCSEFIHVTNPENFCLFASVPEVSQSRASLSCTPNPANDHATVTFDIPSGSNVNISVVNMLGNRVLLTGSKYYPGGRNELRLNVSSLTPGVYFVSMTTEGSMLTTRLVVQ